MMLFSGLGGPSMHFLDGHGFQLDKRLATRQALAELQYCIGVMASDWSTDGRSDLIRQVGWNILRL